jgi:hypothetical protein
MTTFTSKCAAGQKPVPSLISGLPGVLLYEFLTTASLAAGDIIDLGPLPANVAPLDVMLVTDDLDTNGTPTITLSVGLLNAGKTDLNGGTNETWITASTVGQAGGIARATTAAVYLLGASTSERRLGIKVVAAAATGTGAGEKIAVLVTAQG